MTESVKRKDYDLLVIGELNVDLILSGPDVTPEFGQVEKVVDRATLALGGSSALFASGASRLGLQVAFAGKIGDDEMGQFARARLEEQGVDVSPIVVDPNIKTGLTVHLARPDDRAMLTYLGSIAAFRAEEVDRALLSRTRHVHVSSIFLQHGLRPGLPGLLATARAAGATCSLDPGWDPAEQWNGTLSETLAQLDIFLPNEQEAQEITREEDLNQALDRLAQRIPLVVTKLGRRGAVARRGEVVERRAAPLVEAIDTTGAGDNFNAGFLYGYLKGWTLADCLTWGTACGAICTTRAGGTAAQPTAEEVERFLARP